MVVEAARPLAGGWRPSKPREDPVRAGDGQGAVADGERDALGRAAADVAGGEDPRAGGLDRAGLAVREGPAIGTRGIGPREDEPLGIDGDPLGHPGDAWPGADEDEQRRAIDPAGSPVADV